MATTAAAVCLSEFCYHGYFGCRSTCRLQVFDLGPSKPYTVLVTELDSNPGTSITNAVEILAEQVWRLLEKPVRGMQWIEHYEDRAFLGGKPLFKEEFDLVMLDQDGCTFRRPRWRRISKEEAGVLCGACL